jgi:hypothetical protein
MPLILPVLLEQAPIAVVAPAPPPSSPPVPVIPLVAPPRRPPEAASAGPDGRERRIEVQGEAFVRYAHERWNGQQARAFDLPRARLGADAVLREHLAARVLIETVRSAAPGSLYGVEGDSIVLRAREIYGELRSPTDWPARVRLRLGLLPTLAITPLEQMWGRRVVAPSAQEASGLLSPSDLGAALLVALPRRLGEIAVAAVNGEGFTQREQNEGKNLQFRLWLTPLDALLPPSLSVKVLVHVEDGSLGPTQARADRHVGGLSVEHLRGALGVDGTFANGSYGNSAQYARTATAWARVGPFQGFEAVVRLDQVDPDRRANQGEDRVTTWQTGVGYHGVQEGEVRESFELYLTYRHTNGGGLARAADPRLPQRGPRLDLKVSF